MTEPQEPVVPAGVRIGTAEREAALEALGEHMRAGRLEPDEYSERAEKVAIARFQSDLPPLFVDLPYGVPTGPATSVTIGSARTSGVGGFDVDREGSQRSRELGQVTPGRPPNEVDSGKRLLAVVPVASLVLFFVCGFAIPGGVAWSWLFFLITPAVGGLVYGDKHAHKRDRNHKRSR